MNPVPSLSPPAVASACVETSSHRLETAALLATGVARILTERLTTLLSRAFAARPLLGPDHPAAAAFVAAEHDAREAHDLSQRLLDFLHGSDAGESRFDLVPHVQEALPLLRAALPGEVALESAFDLGQGFVHGDARGLQHLFYVLALDAAGSSASGRGRLQVRIHRSDADSAPDLEIGQLGPGSHVCLSVRLVPMPNEAPSDAGWAGPTLRHLLWLRNLVLRHQGGLAFRCHSAEGTVAELYLPEADENPHPPPVRGHRILVIDDEETVVRLALQALEFAGYETHSLSSPRAAIELLAKEPDRFDLILTDQRMPTMSGLQLAQALRLQANRTPILITSGSIGAITPDELRDVSPSRFIAKPFTFADLLAAVRELLASPAPAPA